MAGCRLVALCDTDQARLREVSSGKEHAIISTDWKAVVENPVIDSVLIATPADSHFAIAHRALLRGKHVFVEKPLACTSDQIGILDREAQLRGRVLMVDNTYLFEPAVVAIGQFLQSGVLGGPLDYRSMRLNMYGERNDTDVLWDLAWHDLSIVDFLFPGNDWVPCATRLGRHAARLSLYTGAGPKVQIEVDWTATIKKRLVRIACSHGEVLYDDLAKLKVKVCTREGVSALELGDEEPLKAALRHFLDCVRDQKQPVSGAAMGLRIARLLEAAEPSETGASVLS